MSYPKNCKECYCKIVGTCLLWQRVKDIGCNRHPNCPEDMKVRDIRYIDKHRGE